MIAVLEQESGNRNQGTDPGFQISNHLGLPPLFQKSIAHKKAAESAARLRIWRRGWDAFGPSLALTPSGSFAVQIGCPADLSLRRQDAGANIDCGANDGPQGGGQDGRSQPLGLNQTTLSAIRKRPLSGALAYGGEGGIRTHGTL